MEITIGGTTYKIRCDMNVVEKLIDEYGGLQEVLKTKTVGAAKFMAAEMINEHNYATGNPERVEAQRLGAAMTMEEYREVYITCIQCLTDCVAPKKK